MAEGAEQQGRVWQRYLDLAVRFEELLQARPEASPPIAEIRAAFGVSSAVFGASCRQQLGISPTRYLRLRRLQRLRQALVTGDAGEDGLAGLARCHGIRDVGRFAAAYQAFFGEPPSATLRRTRLGGSPPPRRRRPGEP